MLTWKEDEQGFSSRLVKRNLQESPVSKARQRSHHRAIQPPGVLSMRGTAFFGPPSRQLGRLPGWLHLLGEAVKLTFVTLALLLALAWLVFAVVGGFLSWYW